jgi:hypothetical protein
MWTGGNRRALDAFDQAGISDLSLEKKYACAAARQYALQLQTDAEKATAPPPELPDPAEVNPNVAPSMSDPSVDAHKTCSPALFHSGRCRAVDPLSSFT